MTGTARPKAETELQNNVIQLVKTLGGRTYHTYDARHSEPGWPDLVVGFPGAILFRELKSATGVVSAAQQWWLDTLLAAGLDTGVWRPLDLREGRISQQLTAARRAGRARLADPPDYHAGPIANSSPHPGRADTCERCAEVARTRLALRSKVTTESET